MTTETNNLLQDARVEKSMEPLESLYGDSWETMAPSFLTPATLLAQSGLSSPVDSLCAYFLYSYVDTRRDKSPRHHFYLSDEECISTLENFRHEFGEKVFSELEDMLALKHAEGIPSAEEVMKAPLAAKRYSLAMYSFLIPQHMDAIFNRSFTTDMTTGVTKKQAPNVYALQFETELCDTAEAVLKVCKNNVSPFLEQRLSRELTAARAQLAEGWKAYPQDKQKRHGGPRQ